MSEYQEFRVAYEFTSAILCFIILWFMIKPYRFTREGRYIGLPLAFGLLGASYFFSAITYAAPFFLRISYGPNSSQELLHFCSLR